MLYMDAWPVPLQLVEFLHCLPSISSTWGHHFAVSSLIITQWWIQQRSQPRLEVYMGLDQTEKPAHWDQGQYSWIHLIRVQLIGITGSDQDFSPDKHRQTSTCSLLVSHNNGLYQVRNLDHLLKFLIIRFWFNCMWFVASPSPTKNHSL